MQETRKTGFVRDIIIKIFLILLFVFLITILFPMPNLKPFYNSIFNNNVQSMKDAAESYFTKDRMPEKVGDSAKLTLKDMLDKKLILPFLDEDGNECNTSKSYVKVTKEEKEYKLEVHLSCPTKEDYVIEPIGCYNFCDEKETCECSCDPQEKPVTSSDGKVTINKVPSKPSNTPNNTSNDKYKMQYLYKRVLSDVTWNTGNYVENKQKETDDIKLVDTKTQYTGKRKISSGNTLYKHIKYGYKDNWTIDTDWTYELKDTNENFRLYAVRTLYAGQRKVVKNIDNYKHVKYGYKDNITKTSWTTEKKNESDTVKILEKRYTVRKTVNTTTGTWSDWIKEGVWRSSKPANTSSKQWSEPYNVRTNSTWKTIYNSYETDAVMPEYVGNRRYEELTSSMDPCTNNCNSVKRKHYYRVYELQQTKEYMYMYRTYSTNSSTRVDEQVVSDPKPYTDNGYTIVKTEYIYSINNREKYIIDTKWTQSRVSPEGYEFTGTTKVTKKTTYETIKKWVTSREKLGEYTYGIITKNQYKYRLNNPIKYVADTIWTKSVTSPNGYTYTGENKTTTNTSYEDLGKWVNSKSELGEYTYDVETRKLYRYKYRKVTTKTESDWFDKDPKGDWVYANQTRKVKVN